RSGLDPNPQPNTAPGAIIQVFGRRASDNHIIAVSISMPPSRFVPRDVNLGFIDAFGVVFDFDPATNMTTVIGYMMGTLHLTAASATTNASVAGSFDAKVDVQGTPPP
ncbi:MAG TPA: hypothetical protein VLB44_26040, partial [Kofleriaceae bacterium]|nr:hypothetical protein [Kofleriaceae bacterium]